MKIHPRSIIAEDGLDFVGLIEEEQGQDILRELALAGGVELVPLGSSQRGFWTFWSYATLLAPNGLQRVLVLAEGERRAELRWFTPSR